MQPAQRQLLTLGKAQLQHTSHSFSHMLVLSDAAQLPARTGQERCACVFLNRDLISVRIVTSGCYWTFGGCFAELTNCPGFGWDRTNFLSICSVYKQRGPTWKGLIAVQGWAGQWSASSEQLYCASLFWFWRFFPPSFINFYYY